MASNTYGNHYLQGWADANAGLYKPPGSHLHRFLTNPARGYELETNRLAYDDGYRDRRGGISDSSGKTPVPQASRRRNGQ